MDTGGPTRILIFSLAYHPFVGGAELAIKEIVQRIPREELAFDLITMRFDRKLPLVEMVGNVRVYRVIDVVPRPFAYLNKVLFPFFAAVGAIRLHRKHHYQGCWAMMSYMVFPIVLMRAFGTRLPYALTLQDGDPFERVFRRWFIVPLRPLLKYGFRRASVITAISNYLGEWARRMGYEGPLEIIPNGVDAERFMHVSPHEVAMLKQELHKKEDEVFLITTSRLVPKNGVDTIIRALPYLPERVTLLILGEGPEEEKLKLLAQELEVVKRARFLGFVPHAKLPFYLHASDIFVRPSRSEGMGSSFVEAMAAGLPVIATQEGGIADFLFDAERNPDHGPTGFAVDVDAPDQIAAQVEQILADRAQTAAVVQRAREMARSKYDWSLIAEDMRRRAFEKLI